MKSIRMHTRRPLLAAPLAALTVLLAGLAPLAHGQERYPTKPIRMVIGFAAGGPTDVVARKLAQRLEPLLGQTVIVYNKQGSSTTIATA